MKDRPRPVREHFRELRRRLTWSAGFLAATTAFAFVFWQEIFEVLLIPAGDALNPETGGKLVFTSITEAWGIVAKVGVIVGLILGMPFFLLQAVLFIRPALKVSERKMLYLLLPAGITAFGAGVAFSFFVLLPPAISFLLRFGAPLFTPLVTVSAYVNLVILLLFWMGLIFEMPIVMFFLARLGVLRSRMLSRGRRWAVVAAFLMGAIITPTFDPVNQLLVAGPIIVMYEIGFWLTKVAERLRARKAARVAG